MSHDEHPAEERESLWMLTVSPVIWATHFMASYLTAAVWCAKYAGPSGTLGPARTAIIIYTVAAIAGIGVVAWIAARRADISGDLSPHDADTAHSRHRFLGLATLLLSGLSAVATLFAAAVIIFVRTCD